MTTPTPLLSVIVPAYQGTEVLPRSLGALTASDLPRDRWELIVVDDASSDGTSVVASRWADRVISLTGRPCGPAYARNRGVEVSRGAWVVFIDADVVVHADTLRRIADVIEVDPGMDAVFGAYDDAPPAPGFVSTYRNLLHRYVHVSGAGEAETFWAGCGAIRRTAFDAVGGFDEHRFTRPQIEDIELGYRLRDRGSRIMIQPDIQGAHLKQWKLLGSLRTDLLDRGIPWVRLLLERRSLARPANLNFKRGERVKAAAVGMALLLIPTAAVLRQPLLVLVASFMLLAVVLSNLPLLSWFARQRGPGFALVVVPFNILYYAVSGLSVVAGVTLHVLAGRPAAIAKVSDGTRLGDGGEGPPR